ncbi:hypothetical protein SAMN02910292_01891 [Lachnospiraceae bacterium XBB2008]|nr:hypothetical protein SAMN02910292_01891 [Lachnospiraceae bacterium XBB2008]
MEVEDGQWMIKGMAWDDPYRIRSWQELVNWINEVGFLPFFSNEIEGFSAEEHVSPDFWWTGDREQDPWEWREIIAASRQVAYGKFFDQKAGFISLEWLPYFVNFRRNGYDFDSRWEDGLASRREKVIMDMLTDRDDDGDMIFPQKQILSTELKKKAGFGGKKTGLDGSTALKNFPGTVTGLQMQTYLVIVDFHRRVNKRGEEYGMPVSVLLPPEAVWGYELVTDKYYEDPAESAAKIFERVKELYPGADEEAIKKMTGVR